MPGALPKPEAKSKNLPSTPFLPTPSRPGPRERCSDSSHTAGPEWPGRGCGSPGRGHGLTCLSLSCSILARRFLSGGERYFCVSNFFSNSMVWSLEKRTCPPFLLCSGRWMKGLHSSGFPAESGTEPRVTDGRGHA